MPRPTRSRLPRPAPLLLAAALLGPLLLAPRGLAAGETAPNGSGSEATLVATRAIRPLTVLGPEDVTLLPGATPGALDSIEGVVGQETRAALYPGRPIRPGDLGPPALVERNATVTLSYRDGALFITTEGRALDRGGHGEEVRVMNPSSRQVITGRIAHDGRVEVRR